ncbi:uncharacterized protein LOC127986809 isoform X1 [Carassius gibelio]|uniref:uncharacterized protein LOC127986809 isoform X1 n=1 Tax=Carassius gibelio TaxID=101364 RepID=UPI0022799C4B|nr:uncharacterized protein LOC127986809 isoform X1 [Carassius gibelio]
MSFLKKQRESSDSEVSSSESVKSDQLKDDIPVFNEETSTKSVRSGSHLSSSVSVKSDYSKGDGPNFSEKTPCNKSVRSGSHVLSSVSVKSDYSKGDGPNFSEKKISPSKSVRSGSHLSSSVSVKSDYSKGDGPNFSEKTPCNKSVRSGSHVLSSVSVKSDYSKGDGPNFSEKKISPSKSNKGQKTTVNIGAEITRWKALKAQKGLKSDVELATFLLNRVNFEKSDSNYKNYFNRRSFRENLLWIFKDLEKKISVFLKNELEKFKKILNGENTQYFVQDFTEEMRDIKEAALDITLYFLKDMKQCEAADTLQDELVLIHQRPLKSNLKKKYQSVSEGIAKHGDSKLLKNIYTDLCMTLSVSKRVNIQNEVGQVQAADRQHESKEIPVECNNLFEAPEQDKEIRTVLTTGVAGIGKSISVQKFIVDWADGKENEDITFIFPLAFREINLKEKETQSLTSLIRQFFPEIKGLNLTRNDKFKFLFILDGLDECRLPLNFEGNEICRDVTSQVSLDVLLTNLIKGNLLPSALIWITTRPAAAIKIPPECVDRVTEVQGFNDAQKEEYFRKRLTDADLANEIIDNVKQSKTLFIMCYIPVFCWITATVLQNILEEKRNNDVRNQADEDFKTLQESNTEDTPKTLTQMYTHFLRFQILQSRRKYEGQYTPDVSWDKDAMLSLGKLAFHQLQRNNLLFYDTDLEACGIDASNVLVYSGMCTQIFKEETGIILGTTFCFVHLSIQEFIAALYAHLFLDIKSVFDHHESTEQKNKNETMIDLLKTAVDKALESETGHLDLFLRFLLGLSLQTNRPLLRGLLTQQDGNDHNYKEIVQYIKLKLEDKKMSPERSINLFYCLNELNDQSLVKEIQTHLNKGSLSSADLSPAQWSAVAFVLLTSEEEMEEFELQKFKKSDECLFRLLEVVKISKSALLNDCNLTDESCSNLAKALGSDNNLIELNMSNNNLQDSGVQQLCIGLENIMCKLEILKLSKCDLTEESCSALASVLSSDSSSLKELDLSNNNLQDSGVKLLSDGLKENCQLKKLRLSNCSITEEGYKALASALRSNPSHLIELDLIGNDPGQSGVKELNDLLQDPNYSLKTLRFLGPAAYEACQHVAEVLDKNPLLLRELNLSEHKLDLKRLTPLLLDKHCKLNKLVLNNSYITDEDCCVLAEAFHSNPSNLKELDLTGTKLRDSGMKIFSTLFENEQCRLEKLKFNCICITKEGCAALTAAFNSNPSNLIELDLSENSLGDPGVAEISKLLGNSLFTLKILRMSNCSITEEGYKALASSLRSNPSHLIELDLTGNDPGESGVKELSDLLQDPNGQLKLRFRCPAAEACQYVERVVGKNPLLLRELNLSEHELGDTRVNQIAALLQDKHCKLNTLILNNNSITEEGCAALTSALNSNPSNLIELDLSGNTLGNKGIQNICLLLKNPQCKLEKLKLSDCGITGENYKTLISVLRSNPSRLTKLDLTGNYPGKLGLKWLFKLLGGAMGNLMNISPAAEEAYEYLFNVLGTNPLLLQELDLSTIKLGDLDWEKLTTLLTNSHCIVEKIKLNNCELTKKSCSVLATILYSKSNLKEMNLNNSRLLDSGVKVICEGLKKSKLEILKLSNCSITEEGYTALASALRSNRSHLKELDLTGNDPGQSGVKELVNVLQGYLCKLRFLQSPAAVEACKYVIRVLRIKDPLTLSELNLSKHKLEIKNVEQLAALMQDKHCSLNKLQLCDCDLTEESCLVLATVLRSNSCLKELDMSNNNLQDSGVKKLQNGLEDKYCTLEKLRLSDCSITEEGYKALASALRSNPSHLIELDLTGNDPGQSGVKELSDLLQDPNCQLKTLRFLKSPAAEQACDYLTEVLGKSPLLLKELDLSEDKLGDLDGEKLSALLMDSHNKVEKIKLNNCRLTDNSCSVLATVLSSKTILKEMNLNNSRLLDSGVKEICEGLKNPVCELKTLKLCKCDLTEESCSALASVLRSDSSSLKDLDLSNNNLQDSGVKLLTDGLKENCKLQKLKLSNCSITEEGYKALASALRSNPSHLIELNLTGNDPGQSGVKELTDLLQEPNCKLILRFLSSEAEEACQYVIRVVNKNPLLVRELNLSKHKLDSTHKVIQLAALLEDKHCKLNIIQMNKNSITEEGCAALTSAFNSNPSNLTELDLSGNKLGNTGIQKICLLLENPQCKLEKLKLSDCGINGENYKTLISVLRSSPSRLTKLDLTGNYPGKLGLQWLFKLLKGAMGNLMNISFLSPAAEEAYEYLFNILGTNPLLLQELDLSTIKLGDLDWEKLAALLPDSHCIVEKIKLNTCELTEKSCSVLATVLSSKPNLKEMNLNNSRLLDSGVKQICEGLKKSKLEILKLSNCSITEEGYKALASALRSNRSHLKELDLTGNDPGQSGVKELVNVLQGYLCKLRFLQSPAAVEACQYVTRVLCIKDPLTLSELNLSKHKLELKNVEQLAALMQDKHCRLNKLQLCDCDLTEESCLVLATVLRSNSSLKELDMSNNNLKDSGIKKLQNGLENKNCTLQKLRLSDCGITEEGYKALASALRSNPLHLIELDLTGNDPGQSGVKELTDLLQDPNCQLKILRFFGPDAERASEYVPGLVGKNLLLVKELNLSDVKLGDTRVNQIAALLRNKHCQLNTIFLCRCSITQKQCLILTSALKSNPSHLRELDLSGNKINTGVNHLCDILRYSHSKLERLRFSGCEIKDEGCSAVSSALKSNPSHLRELDLSGNHLGDSGVKNISDLLMNPRCKLEILNLCGCSITEKYCLSLTSALKSNPSHLRELDLSVNQINKTGVNHLCDVLKDSACKLERLRFRGCEMTDEGCSALTSALKSNPSHLRELDLSGNQLGDSGVKNISDLLMNPQCKLGKLALCGCSITEKQCLILTSALKSNPSHLRELELSGNKIENTGVNHLCDVLKSSHCKLERLSLNDCGITDVACLAQSLTNTKALQFLKELDLRNNNIGVSKEQLRDVLRDSNCKLEVN